MAYTHSESNANHASASSSATASVLADISEDESDDLDVDSLYPESDKENDIEEQKRAKQVPSYIDISKSKERRLQYALFPLPPSSSNGSYGHGTSSPGPRHHHYQHHLQSPNDYYSCTSSARTTRSLTPVSPAFSPHEPPRIPLPQLPNTPSPVLLLPRSREGTSYFQLRRHDNISNTNTSNTTSSTDSRERLETLQEIIINTRSPKSSDDTLSHSPILPYLRKEEGEPADSKARSRTSTIRPFEEKLSLPPSPLHFHEFILDQEEPPLASSSSFTAQQAQATPSLALSPALPIEPARTVSPALKQEQWAEERPIPPPKSPSTSSLQQFDEMLSVALEAANKESANNDEQQVSSVKELSSAITSRTGSLYGASISSDEDLPTTEADLVGASWEDDKIWSRKSSNAASMLESYAIRQKPFLQKKQSKIIFDDCSSSDEEAFDLSLDADTLSTHHSENTYSHHTRRYHQTSSDHSPDPDASPISSSSNWTTSRRVSLAPTEISQASSAGTSTFTSPGGLSTVESNLAATVKHSPKTEDDQRHETSRKGLIPSTPWASSLVTISNSGLAPSLRRPSLQPSSTKEDTVVKLPPRKSSLQQLNQYSVQQQLPMKTLDISPSQSQSQSHSLIRSRLPKMGMMPNFTRRPSDTPSHASSTQSTSSSSKSVYNTPRLLNGHRSPGSPSGASSVGVSNGDGGGNRATLAAFSINKLRTTKSTPLLRIRKSSAQLTSVNGIPMQRGQSQSDMMSKESDKEENEKEGMDQFGIRKGSLPDISNRSDPLMRKKTSFLPSSMRKN